MPEVYPITNIRIDPPPPGSLSYLKARDLAGWTATGGVGMISGFGLWCATRDHFWSWMIGQMILALAFLQWFVLLHEAGHKTLFRRRNLNHWMGHLASIFALIPFQSWKNIHARHHRYTGWQDLDATTALLVPRQIKPWERLFINAAWASGFPLFSILYRIQNFWNLPRVRSFLVHPNIMRTVKINTWALGLLYISLLFCFGPRLLFSSIGLGLILSLMLQDIILLSQHTHMPRELSRGRKVRPFPPMEQEQFTRSIRLPRWLSFALLRFDLHELHHMYVRVSGYDLYRIPYRAKNEVNWFVWLRNAKRLSGTDFLFGSREETGFLQ